MALAKRMNVKVVPRGGGTSLSGGSLPLEDGILLAMGKFNKILEVDYANRCAVVQPGVANLAITRAVEDEGFYYAPDPSSQIACSIGGNVAENSGGIHCLKYGLTTNNILGIEMVLIGGEVVRLGGKHLDSEALDLLGVMTGSEGTARRRHRGHGAHPEEALGGAWSAARLPDGRGRLRLRRRHHRLGHHPRRHGDDGQQDHRRHRGLPALRLPARRRRACHLRARRHGQRGRPPHRQGVGAGDQAPGHDHQGVRPPTRSACSSGRAARTPFPAVGAIGPDYLCMDGTIPRNKLAYVLQAAWTSSARGTACASPTCSTPATATCTRLILYDGAVDGDIERAEAFGADILRLCVEMGGCLTGEHGVGVEKRDLMGEQFTEVDLKQQQRVKCAFDPEHRLNPGKMFPLLHRCAELGKMHVHRGQVAFPELPRF